MTGPEVSRAANLWVPRDAVRRDLPGWLAPGGLAASGYAAARGGLWVGGRVHLRAGLVRFEANAANRALHEGPVDAAVALSDIRQVRVRRGVLTSIIDLETDRTPLTFRCFGARRFAATIREASRSR